MHIRFNHFPFTVNSREMSDDHDVIVDDDDDAVDEKLKILKLSSHDFTVERRWQKLKIWFAKQVTETTKEVKQC